MHCKLQRVSVFLKPFSGRIRYFQNPAARCIVSYVQMHQHTDLNITDNTPIPLVFGSTGCSL